MPQAATFCCTVHLIPNASRSLLLAVIKDLNMSIAPLSADSTPLILFRVEYRANRSLRGGHLYARRTGDTDAPTWEDFDDHLSWGRTPTRFLSFFSSWGRAIKRRQDLEDKRERDIIVIAIWAKDMPGVYSAEEVACRLEYSNMNPAAQRRWDHHDEYLVEGGIPADDYRILAVFEGGGPPRRVVFEWPGLQASTTIPTGFFPGRRSNNPLQDIADEIYSRSGARDDLKRDELVQAISGRLPFLNFEYQ
ncbi:uncharacterized protein BO80DRAFT_284736 [Aspergillus ibericus CBS 121593]|uniref:DUF7587 domain-containing protein n=1 Tax=Aspergillus ibericus CBS 121593 TaxID=1448316 RepID=A0A395H786_9EURO|nr:hypothetical protein BO80DRAFT_284736 [Aspergillus ibericus CBS 121593]RAL03486.1 hypothetical protein BO80DRAFT_284736 [Aspergillus ibericus CBS 121593]